MSFHIGSSSSPALTTLPLPTTELELLRRGGFETRDDVLELSPVQLAKGWFRVVFISSPLGFRL
jgi:hypothetical protein